MCSAVLRLAQKLCLYSPVAGLVAACVYLSTLSPGASPGTSAVLTASAAALLPPSGASHPLFTWAARSAAMLPIGSLPVRLNLFSAVCGIFCAALFYRLVARLILFAACESESAVSGVCPEGKKEPEQSPEVIRHNRRVRSIAVQGGLAAAFLLIFSAPVWAASTRLDRGPFDLLLALASLNLFPVARTAGHRAQLAASVFVFVLGLLESAVFLFLLPVYAYLLLKEGLSTRRRFAFLGWVTFGGVSALGFMALVYGLNMDVSSLSSGFPFLETYARQTVTVLYREARGFFPLSGWALPLIQVGLAAGILVAGRRTLLLQKRVDTAVAQCLLLLAAVPGLLLVPHVAPYAVYASFDHLPVFAAAVLAFGVAIALTSCLLVLVPDERPQVEEAACEVSKRTKGGRQLQCVRVFAMGLIPLLLLVALAVPLRSFSVVRMGRGLFADAVAREVLVAMKGRTWLVSDGVLDNHLRIQAWVAHQPLVVVSLRPRNVGVERKRLDGLIAADPLFEGLNRQRLRNALSIGPARFVSEWLSADTNACRRLMIAAMPEIWAASGYRAVPEGLAFGGVRSGQEPDTVCLVEENSRFRKVVLPLLAGADNRETPSDALREWLRMRLGFAANELGVFLEESGKFETAYQAYEDAVETDPKNISAAINAYGVAVSTKRNSELYDRLRGRVKKLMAGRKWTSQALAGVQQVCGTIRDASVYQREAARWASSGVRAVADDKLKKALALSERLGAASLSGKAVCYLQMGDRERAGELFRDALAADASDRDALIGLLGLALERGNTREAEARLKAALATGMAEGDLLGQTVELALLKTDAARARKLLTDAVTEHPKEACYWGRLAEVMVSQGDALMVQQSLLPQMEEALGPQDRYRVDAIRGLVLCKTDRKRLPEGRLSIRKSLSANAAQPKLWNTLLNIDMAINRPDFIEMDARTLLGLEPDHAFANYLLGAQLLRRGEWKGAEDFLRRSVGKEPLAMACNDLAETLRLLKKTREAEDFARKAIALDPEMPFAHDTLADILYDLGDYAGSAREESLAVAAGPDRPDYQLGWLRALVKMGDSAAVRQKVEDLKRAKIAIPEKLKKESQKLVL